LVAAAAQMSGVAVTGASAADAARGTGAQLRPYARFARAFPPDAETYTPY